MKTPIKVTFLGTGTSGGVPMVSCSCEVCKSTDPHDKRLRTSILIKTPTTTICIDAGPDFRSQMLTHDVRNLDAILVTHGHRDHVGGLDDVRPFNFLQGKWMDVYCDEFAEQMIRDQYSYAFTNLDYAYAPKLNFIPIDQEKFTVNDLEIQPITVMHHQLPVKAFRIGHFTYITDAKTITDVEFEKINGTKVLVINALRAQEHNAHFTIDQALEMVERIKPERAYFIHMSHHFGKHADIQPILPANVTIAYDGLEIEIA